MEKVIMIVTNRYDPDVRVHKEAKYLVAKGYDVEVLCWDREHEYINKGIEEIDGVKIKRFFPYAKYGSGLRQIGAFLRFICEVRSYIKNMKIHYLHCHDLDGIIVGFLSSKRKEKLIFDMHEFYEVLGSNQKIRYIVRSIVSYFQKKSDWIIYVNEEQARVINKQNKGKLVYLPNYPDDNYFNDVIKTNSVKLRIAYIGSVRQYVELKNLMDACRNMKNVEVLIHGMGVAYKSLDNIKDDYCNVKITGKYDLNQISSLYKDADVLYVVYPMDNIQYQLAYPVKFYEAILTKTPIISNIGCNVEKFIKKHNVGFVVDGNSVESIRTCIEMIVLDRNLLDEKTTNLEKIQNDYVWRSVIKHLDQIYI